MNSWAQLLRKSGEEPPVFLSKQNSGGFSAKSLVKNFVYDRKGLFKIFTSGYSLFIGPLRAADSYLFATCQWAASE
jgi:hypothetical protein